MGLGQDRTATPGSAVGLASVARHVTDCASSPVSSLHEFLFEYINVFLQKLSCGSDLGTCLLMAWWGPGALAVVRPTWICLLDFF